MTISLNITQRLQLVAMLEQQKGAVGYIRHCLSLIEKIMPGEDSLEAIRYREEPPMSGRFVWDMIEDEPTDSELTREQKDALRTAISQSQVSPRDMKSWLGAVAEQLDI